MSFILGLELSKSLTKKGAKFIQNQVYTWLCSLNHIIEYKYNLV